MSTGSLRSNRNFMLLWVAQSVSQLGNGLSAFAFPLIAAALFRSPVVAGLATGALVLGRTVPTLPAGLIADRYNLRTVVILANASGGLAMAALVTFYLGGQLAPTVLIIAAFASGAASAVADPAEVVAVTRLVADEQLHAATSRMQARAQLVALVGGPVGGLLFGVHAIAPFVADLLTYLTTAALAALVPGLLLAPVAAAGAGPPMNALREGIRYAVADGFTRAVMLAGGVGNFAISGIMLVVIVSLQQAGADPRSIGLISLVTGLAGIIGATVSTRLGIRLSLPVVAVGGSAVAAAVFAALAVHNSVPFVAALLSLAAFMTPIRNSRLITYRLLGTPEHLRGRATAAVNFLATAAAPAGPVLGGILLAQVGRTAAILSFAAVVITATAVLALTREVRHAEDKRTKEV